MKKTILLCGLLMPMLGLAQNYSIGWHKVSGGGGASINGQYSVSGTIGQPDAGAALTGGGYSVTGGFWSLYAVQTPGAPTLTIHGLGTHLVVSWPSSAAGYTLQQNSSVRTTNWITSGYAISTNGATESITVTNPAAVGTLFFRLFK